MLELIKFFKSNKSSNIIINSHIFSLVDKVSIALSYLLGNPDDGGNNQANRMTVQMETNR